MVHTSQSPEGVAILLFILVQIYLTNILQFGLKKGVGWKGWNEVKANLVIYLCNSCLKEYKMMSLRINDHGV